MSQEPTDPAPSFEITTSRNLLGWMADTGLSLAFTTYQTGKLFLLGLQPNGRFSVFERTFNRCMGLCGTPDGQTLWMSSLYQLWRFENVLEPGQSAGEGYDRLYVPIKGHTTGDVDIHDLVVQRRPTAEGGDRPVFACTLFNCLATVSETHSLQPLWKPPFISALMPEDRCHLNGLAADPETSKPRYVTCVSRSDVADGWRDRREGGGVVIDVDSNEIVAEGLSMPHSPRLHPNFPGKLWVINSGTGFLGYVDLETGKFEEVTFLSGKELYDVVALPGSTRPMALGFKTDEIRRMLRLENMGTL